MRLQKGLLGKCFGLLLVAFLFVAPSASLIAKAEVVEDLFTVEYNASTHSLINTEVSGTVLLDGNFNDPQGLTSAKIGLNGIWFCEFNSPESGYRECTIDTTTLPNGMYSITFWAQNSVGVEKGLSAPIYFTINNAVVEPVDTSSPEFHLKEVTRDENESAPDYSEFVAHNPESLEISCYGLEGVDMKVAQPLSSKLILVTCMVEDAAGNQTTSQTSLIVNNVQPQVVIIANPSTSVNSGGTVSLVGNILKGNGDFSYYWFGACSGSGNASMGLTSSINVSLNSGTHLCGIMVTDADGDTTAASVALDFGINTNNSESNQNTGNVNGDSISADETDSTNESEETNNTEDESDAQVEGTNTESPASNPESSSEQTNNTDAEVTTSNAGASPLVIICLVAGGILIIALLLFLFFRGEDEEDETAAAA